MDSQRIINVAEFIIGAFLEVWTCQNEYIIGNEREPMSFWSYNKPSNETLHSIKIYIVHVQSAVDLTRQTVENTTILKSTGQGQGLQGIQTLAYRLTRQSLYPFLKLDFEYGNLQDFEVVVDLWITYLTPWKKRGEDYSELWYFKKMNFKNLGETMSEIILCTILDFCLNS